MTKNEARKLIKLTLNRQLTAMKVRCSCIEIGGPSPDCKNGCVDQKKYDALKEAVSMCKLEHVAGQVK